MDDNGDVCYSIRRERNPWSYGNGGVRSGTGLLVLCRKLGSDKGISTIANKLLADTHCSRIPARNLCCNPLISEYEFASSFESLLSIFCDCRRVASHWWKQCRSK